MPRENRLTFAFNRGLVSRLALARIDLEKRVSLSAEEQSNWMPRTLGSMMLRPGWRYVGGINDDAPVVHIPFVFSLDDTAIIELTDKVMRVRVSEVIISRPSVTSAVTNGTFTSDLTGWTDADESGAASTWNAGAMDLLGTGFNAAIRRQQVTVSGGNVSVEHALRVVVSRGPVMLRVGSASGGDEYISETTLETGTHSLALTPTGDFHITLMNRLPRSVLVDSITVEVAGDMEIATPWVEDDLGLIRHDQSGDVIFVACDGYQQRRIERRGTRSWSVVLYQAEDGPYRAANTGTTSLTASGLSGSVTLTASQNLFRSGHVGALFRLTSINQRVVTSLNGANQFGAAVKVTGTGGTRNLRVLRTGTWSATLTLQRSVSEPGAWTNVVDYTTNADDTYNDGLDNQVIYYRIGIKTGNYTSGTADTELATISGGITGTARITAYSSQTSVTAEVLEALGSTEATTDWSEGEWSSYRGFPSSVAFYEGRLWWAGRDKWWGSVSDAFDSFDDTVEGDSGPINRSIGSGPVDRINWLLALQRLLAGGQGAEHSARSTTFDEPLTPTNFNLKQPSTQGSAAVPAVKIDSRGVFVQRSGQRLYLLEFDSGTMDYFSSDLTAICPEVGEAGIVRLAVQRQPDTRVHCVLADGTVAVLVLDTAEDVKCFVTAETDGLVEDAIVLPGDEEDRVYYAVSRTVNGQTKRFLECWALESECVGGSLNKQADSFVSYSGSATTTVTAAHLAGEEVVVWADGANLGTVTLNGSGQATLAPAVSNYVVGLYYRARYKSTKQAFAAAMGTALTQRGRIDSVGLILADTHKDGLRYGQDFDTMDGLPLEEDGATVAEDYVWEAYDQDMIEFPGDWDTDPRVCLEAESPKPCTVLGLVVSMYKSG